VALQVLA